MTRLVITALLAASLLLCGCGKLGSLEQPGPLFGAKAKAEYAAKKRAEADARAKAKAESQQPDASDAPPPPQGALPNAGQTPNP
jgi:hypothetical protein